MGSWAVVIPVLVCAGLACGVRAQVLDRGDMDGPGAKPAARATRPGGEVRAQLIPRQHTTLAAEIGARISKLPVPEGGRFKSGDVLAAFDCLVPAAQMRKAEAALAGSEKTLQANLRLKEYNSVGQLELDVSRSEHEKNVADVAQMAAILSKCNVLAPFSGRIAEQKVREQQYVQPGQALLDVLDDSELELEFIVPSRWLQWVKPGYGFRVRIDETGRSYPARVQRVGARVDPVSQSIKVTATFDGRFSELLAGMSGRASLGSAAAP